jgi:hypothetical protein
MRKSFILGSVAALAISGQALAEDGFNYTFLDLGYADQEVELDDFGVDIDGDGFAFGGSVALTDRFHLIGGYSELDLEVDGQPIDVDSETFNLGGGVNLPLNPKLDFVGTLTYVKAELDGGSLGSVDDDGFGLGAGLRGRVAERLELTGGIQYVDLSESGDDTAIGVGARYFFTDVFALVANFSAGDDTTAWMLGGRFNFNK